MPESRKATDASSLSKRGGYSGSKPGSSMRPPVHVPASAAGRPAKPAGSTKKG